MVDIFIIHTSKDYSFVKRELEPYIYVENDNDESQNYRKINVLELEPDKKGNWKSDAKRKIKKEQAVIIVVGEDANAPIKKDIIGWQVRQELKYNKLLMIYNRDNYDIPFYLMTVDRFSKQQKVVAKEMELNEIRDRIEDLYERIF